MGRSGGGQSLSLGSRCEYVGVVLHELMHAIGKYRITLLKCQGEYLACNSSGILKFEPIRFHDNLSQSG